jgi:hypothetical protein
MNKQIAKALGIAAREVAHNFSNKNREGNYKGETFSVHEVIPTSDQTAIVFFKKNTRKLGMGFFYYINRGYSQGWKYFFPTDSHVTGMMATQFYKLEVERINYKENFSLVEEYNRNRSPEDHISEVSQIGV